MIPENEYGRLLTAGRIFFTVTSLMQAISIASVFSVLKRQREIFDNLVTGGTDAMPLLTRLLISWQWPLAAVAGLLTACLLRLVWRTARLSTIVWAGAALSLMPMVQGLLVQIGIQDPLTTIISKFAQ